MGTVLHNKLNDPELHEPKGAATALLGQYFVSDGAGSGEWGTYVNDNTIFYYAVSDWGFISPIRGNLTRVTLDYWFPHTYDSDMSQLHINGVNIPDVVSDDPSSNTFKVQERLVITGAPTIEIGDEIQFWHGSVYYDSSLYHRGGQLLVIEGVT